MDPAIGWFQPEQKGPALNLWTEIWNTHQRLECNDFNLKKDVKLDSTINGTCLPVIEDRKVVLKKTENNLILSDCVASNRFKKKENKASTFAISRNEELIKSGGTPWKTDDKIYAPGLDGLHEEIEDFYRYMTPTLAEHNIRLEVVERITKIILSVWPHAQVEVYGSFRTGLYLPTSDIDLVVIEKKDISFRTLEKALSDNNIAKASSIKVLDKASVPIVKLTDAKTDTKIDISFNMNNGVKSANLIKEFMKTYPALPKLVLVLKQFLLQRDLNEVFLGGISSYSLILLTISFLQHIQIEPNLGKMLIMFFELYGRHFNYRSTGISVKNGGAYFTKEGFNSMTDGNRPSILCIEDPLLPGNDIGRSSYGALNVKIAFEYAFKILSEAVRPSGACENCSDSILGRIILITDEVIDYRKWICETFPAENVHAPSVVTSQLSKPDTPVNKAKVAINGQINGTTSQGKETCSSGSSDCQSSTHSSCISVGSGSSASSMASDTDSDFTTDVLMSKLDLEAESNSLEFIKQSDKSFLEHSACTDATVQMPANFEKRTSNSCSSEKTKSLQSNGKASTVNGPWKQKKFTPNTSQNSASNSVNGANKIYPENHNIKPSSCVNSNASKKKHLNRKDSINVNISARKDSHVIIGR